MRQFADSRIEFAPYEIKLIGIDMDSTYYDYIYDWVHHTLEYYQKPERGYPFRADMERVMECCSAHFESMVGHPIVYTIR